MKVKPLLYLHISTMSTIIASCKQLCKRHNSCTLTFIAAAQRISDKNNAIKAKVTFQFKFTREIIKPQIWCQNFVFSTAFFYGKTTEINFSALGRNKRLGQNSHDDIPPLKQHLNITLSITDSSNIDGDQMNL